jgi:hypothetical protein
MHCLVDVLRDYGCTAAQSTGRAGREVVSYVQWQWQARLANQWAEEMHNMLGTCKGDGNSIRFCPENVFECAAVAAIFR